MKRSGMKGFYGEYERLAQRSRKRPIFLLQFAKERTAEADLAGYFRNDRPRSLNVVLYGRIPGNAFQGNWTVGVYLDQRADQQQAQALGNIFSGQAGGWPSVLGPLIGNLLAPKQVPIRFETVD